MGCGASAEDENQNDENTSRKNKSVAGLDQSQRGDKKRDGETDVDVGRYAAVSGILCVHFAFEDRYFLCGGVDGALHCFNNNSTKQVGDLATRERRPSPGRSPNNLSISAADMNSSLNASGQGSKQAFEPRWRIKAHRGAITGLLSTAPSTADVGLSIITCAKDGNVAIWKIDDGSPLGKLSGHSLSVNCIAFRSKDLSIYSGSNDKVIIGWDLKLKKEKRKFLGHSGTIWCLACTVDGTKLISGGDDRVIRIWSTADGKELGQCDGSRGAIYTICLSYCAKFFFTSNRLRVVTKWDIATRASVASIVSEDESVSGISVTADDRLLAVVGGRTVRLWNHSTAAGGATTGLGSNENTFLPQFFEGEPRKDGIFTSVHCSSDNLKIALGRDLSGFRILDSTDFALPRSMESLHKGTIASLAVSESNDFELAASASEDTKISLWRIASGQVVRRYEGHTSRVWSISFSNCGEYLYTGSEDSTVRVWSVRSGMCEQVLRGHSDCIWALTVLPSSSGGRGAFDTIVSGGDDFHLLVWRKSAAQQSGFEKVALLKGHTSPVVAVASARMQIPRELTYVKAVTDAKMLEDDDLNLSGSEDGGESNQQTESTRVARLEQLCTATVVASGSFDCTINLWFGGRLEPGILHQEGTSTPSEQTNAKKEILHGHTEVIWSLCFVPTENFLVSGSEDKSLRIWNIGTCQCSYVLSDRPAPVASLCISRDPADRAGLLVGHADGSLAKLDVNSKSVVKIVAGAAQNKHQESICSLASTPVVHLTGSVDMKVHYWPHTEAAAKQNGDTAELRSLHELSTNDDEYTNALDKAAKKTPIRRSQK